MRRRSASAAGHVAVFLAGMIVGTYAPSLTEQLFAASIRAGSAKPLGKDARVGREKKTRASSTDAR